MAAAPLCEDGRSGLRRLFALKVWVVYAIWAVLDLISVGMGMGVPVVTILLGLPAGWYFARRELGRAAPVRATLGRSLAHIALLVLFTFAVMLVIWAPPTTMLFDPQADLGNFGIPMFLYTPKASFIGWMVLMIVLSPGLQALTAVFAAYLTVWRRLE